MSPPPIIYPYGPSESTCGYCGSSGQRSVTEFNRTSANLDALTLTCDIYQRMLDRGWRRSGTYCYKPDLRNSCCPQYTIKLDALLFRPSKSQRKVLRRWNNFVCKGNSDKIDKDVNSSRPSNSKGEASLASLVHGGEVGWIATDSAKHRFETTLEPASFSTEKYELFKNYQEDIHHDTKNSIRGFTRFLCDSPLRSLPIPYNGTPPNHLPLSYGSYHQMYRLDGELVAMAVLDILPSCISSVYFIYGKKWEKYSFGKLSACREASLACEIHEAGASQMGNLYMGFYIHSCPKMRYKGEYSPSFLADPETYEWYPLETCVQMLDGVRYACFSSPEQSSSELPVEDFEYPDPPVPASEDLQQVLIIKSVEANTLIVEPVTASQHWKSPSARLKVLRCIQGLGLETSKDVIFTFDA